MKKISITLILVLICVNQLSAETINNIPSAFLDIGFGARAMAMGGAYTALADNAYSIAWNPAGISLQQTGKSLTFSSVKMMNLINYNHLGYSMSFTNGISLGFLAVYSGDDAMSETTLYYSNAIQGKSFKKLPKSLKFVQDLSLGINLKYYSSSFGNNSDGSYVDQFGEHQVSGSAGGFGLDFGINYNLSENTRLGIMYRNTINRITWNSKNGVGTAKGDYVENLPRELTIGYCNSLDYLVFAIDYDKSFYSDVEDVIHTGIELPFLKKMLGNHLLLRGGFSQELFTSDNKIYSFGAGANFEIFTNGLFSMDIGYQIQSIWKGYDNLRLSFDIAM